MAMSQIMEVFLSSTSFSWFEGAFLLCFALGFAFLRLDMVTSPKKKMTEDTSFTKPFSSKLKQAIDGGHQAHVVLRAWKDGRAQAPTPGDLFKHVVQALLECEPQSLVEQLTQHFREHPVLANIRYANLAIDTVARSGQIQVMEELVSAIRQLHMRLNLQTYEVLLGGYATAGDHKKVEEVCAEVSACRLRLNPRGLSLVIKGFLKNGMVEATIEKFLEMKELGYQLPSFAVTQLLRVACDANRGEEVYARVKGMAPPSAEAVAVLLDYSCRRQDMTFAKRVEKDARDDEIAFTVSIFDPLLKLYTQKGQIQVLALFEEMQKSNIRITEGLCAALLARCAEAKFLRFADEIVRHARATTGMTIAMYSALMKVYAYCDMYGKACDLYDVIIKDGLQPDAMMCGCLMKFAVECGRTDLSRQIAEVAPTLEIQNYMSLIRAAGRDKDVKRAFSVLEHLKTSKVPIDSAVHNCVLDVCVSAGDMDRARQLVAQMRAVGHLDVITYNTLIKGYCHQSDLKTARSCLDDMVRDGIKPNDISYNCLLNACVHVGHGSFKEAWATIDRMEKSGVAVDHYTISILMKALKRVNNPWDVVRSLELLDRSGIDVCSDEILLNSVLETCTRHQESRRLESILAHFEKSSLRASVSTYGSLIKAAGTLKQLPQCWRYWKALEERGVEPSPIVLGCMLDALVCNGEVEQAVDLLKSWKGKGMSSNAIMYSTIIKGFAGTGQSKRAMAVMRDMRAEGMKMTTVVFNAVLDAQARAGTMEEVAEVLDTMKADQITPDSISWATIVKGYCVQGDLSKALEVFRSSMKTTKDSMIYNNILDGCIRHSRFDLADTLLEEMDSSTVVPSNYTFGVLVKLFSRRRQVDKAHDMILGMSKKFSIEPNNQVRTCLMCAYLNANSPGKAMQVFEELKASPAGADAKAYSSLICGLLRHRQLNKAVSVVEEAYGLTGKQCLRKNQSLEADTLEKVFVALGQRGLAQSIGAPLLERLRAAGVPCNGKLYTAVLSGDPRDNRRNCR